MSTSLTLMERFWAKVDKAESGCWNWTASLRNGGYGQFRVGDVVNLAHRFYYEHVRGPVPVGLELDHLCRNRTCVNPDHLEPVTHTENMQRATRLQTHCRQGHEFRPDNLYINKRGGSRAHRVCRTCVLSGSKKYSKKYRDTDSYRERARLRMRRIRAAAKALHA